MMSQRDIFLTIPVLLAYEVCTSFRRLPHWSKQSFPTSLVVKGTSTKYRRRPHLQTFLAQKPCLHEPKKCCRGGSVSLNHTKLMKSSTTGLVSLFEPLSSRGNKEHRWLREVEPPQPHVKLHCRPVSLCCTMVRTGLAELNHWN